jgi:geranylgeranyl diphosphate synthase type II
MLSFTECQQIAEEYIIDLLKDNKEPKELYDPIRYILSLGGKRIRPVSTLMACNLFSDDVKEAIAPAVSLEVFHNFTLLHDDIMDNAPVRRGKPTVHAKWNNNVAILSGDAMQILAYQLMCKSNSQKLGALLELFNTTAIEVCEGQQYDMNFASRNNVTIQEYTRMIELKTSVLLAACMKTGAICGGASAADANHLYEFGRNLGLAFQVQDDYLDAYADEETFGKKTGGDIAENKKTFLLIKAIELAQTEELSILKKAFDGHIPDVNEKIRIVKSVYDKLGIPQITAETIKAYSDKAFEYLESVRVSFDRKEPLHQLALSLMNRQK